MRFQRVDAFHMHDGDVANDGFTPLELEPRRCAMCEATYFGAHTDETCRRLAGLNEEYRQ